MLDVNFLLRKAATVSTPQMDVRFFEILDVRIGFFLVNIDVKFKAATVSTPQMDVRFFLLKLCSFKGQSD